MVSPCGVVVVLRSEVVAGIVVMVVVCHRLEVVVCHCHCCHHQAGWWDRQFGGGFVGESQLEVEMTHHCHEQVLRLVLRPHLVGLPLLGPPLQFSVPSAVTYNLIRLAHIWDNGRDA